MDPAKIIEPISPGTTTLKKAANGINAKRKKGDNFKKIIAPIHNHHHKTIILVFLLLYCFFVKPNVQPPAKKITTTQAKVFIVKKLSMSQHNPSHRWTQYRLTQQRNQGLWLY